ncbi:hypothetical protein TNCV_2949961 [Trichonephila clavipes]|nr:hypothetical protein TNCV_2949961 [Trichonephila clavipes]
MGYAYGTGAATDFTLLKETLTNRERFPVVTNRSELEVELYGSKQTRVSHQRHVLNETYGSNKGVRRQEWNSSRRLLYSHADDNWSDRGVAVSNATCLT